MSSEVQRYITGIMTPVEMANPGPASISARQTVVVTYEDYAALEAELERRKQLDQEALEFRQELIRERDDALAQLAAIQGGMGEELEVVAWAWDCLGPHVTVDAIQATELQSISVKLEPLMTVAQHERIVAALQRTQDAGVPDAWRDLLRRARRFVEDWDDDSQEFMDLCREIDNALAAAPAQPAAQDQGEVQSAAVCDVLAERNRQITAEGWTPEHDDQHGDGQMAVAAGYYALACGWPHERDIGIGQKPAYWPWHATWWKPAGQRRNLVKAGALILAEIERLDRAALAASTGQEVKL